MKKLTIILICAALCIPGFTSCDKNDRGSGLNHMYNAPLLGNPQSLDPQFADDPSSNTVIKNLYSGLLKLDSKGNISCCNAESYSVSDDRKVYTFKLRKDNCWFFDLNKNDIIEDGECFPVTARDYVFALKRILDPKMQSPYANSFSCIKNGRSIADGSASPDSLGVSALNEFTLEITLDYPTAEFLPVLASSAAFPCNEEFFNSTKGRYGLDDRSIMSNGAFYVRQWFYDPYGNHNILYMKRNEKNAGEAYEICPSYLSFTIEKNESDIRDCLKDDSIECLSTFNNSYSGKKYSVTEGSAYTLGLVFNPKDNYFSNKNLRKALAMTIDREALAKKAGSGVKIADGIIPPSVMIAGRSYRELSSDKQFDSFDSEKAKEYMETAKSELKIGSLENVKILVCTEIINSANLIELSQQWQNTLGIYIGIEDVSHKDFLRRVSEGDYTIALYPLKGRIGIVSSVLEQFETTECLKHASDGVAHSENVRKSDTVPKLVENCTAAERDILSAFGFIPLFYKSTYFVTDIDNEDILFDPFTEAADFRLAKNYG
ncbi:MAG TPA: peptide ABC transporter substrate-binding protein [Ruminococcus sp.]